MSALKRVYWFALSPIGTTVISFASLPLLTLKLGPADYGIFGLGAAVASLISGMGSFGALLFLGGQRPSGDIRRDFVFSAVASTAIAAGFVALCILGLWWIVKGLLPDLAVLTNAMIALVALIGWFGAFSAVTSDVLVHYGLARAYTISVVGQALIFATTAIICAFALDTGSITLFLAGTAGAAAQTTLAFFFLRNDLKGRFSLSILRSLVSIAVPTLSANYVELARNFVERWLIGLSIGLHTIGLYAHSQQYRSMINTLIKIPIRSLWQTTLAESLVPNPTFPRLYPIWNFIDNVVALAGLSFVFIGQEAVGFITHGKFSEAAIFATVWMALILVQNAGRPYNSLIIAHGKGAVMSRIQLKSKLVTLVTMPIGFYVAGLWGIFGAIGLESLVIWAMIRHAANKINRTRRSDTRPMSLAVVILLALAATQTLQPALSIRLYLLAFVCILFSLMAIRNEVVKLLFRRLFLPSQAS